MFNPNRPHLPADTLWLERATLIGDSISQMFFGIVVLVFAQIIYTLLGASHRRLGERFNWPLIAYTCLLFALCTTFVGMDLHSLRMMFIDNREAPGGPIAYELSQYGRPITVIPNACAIVGDWLATAFLLYRCLVIFHLKFYVVIIPILVYLGSVAMGCMVLFRASQPKANLWSKTTVDFGVPYFSLIASLNILITSMISVRLLIFRRNLRRTMGHDQSLSVPYISIVTMLVESSALYAVFSILFIGPYGAGSHVSNIFLPNMVIAQFLAPMLIILRVAKRNAWNSNTITAHLSTLKFQTRVDHSTGDDDGDSHPPREKPDESLGLQIILEPGYEPSTKEVV